MWEIRTAAVRVTCATHYTAAVIDTMCAAPPPASMPGLIEAGGAFVEEQAGSILGYAILDSATGEVDAVFVRPECQGRGIARRLLASLETTARERGVERLFLWSSLNAVPFYAGAGFVAVREESYRHRSGIGIPAVLMEKRLT